jgi:hypothetical protein
VPPQGPLASLVFHQVCVDDVVPHQPNGFEVYGYDVLLDAEMRAWLIEVNASPSLSLSGKLDEVVKRSLVSDSIALVEPLPFDRRALLEVTQHRMAVHRAASLRCSGRRTGASTAGKGVPYSSFASGLGGGAAGGLSVVAPSMTLQERQQLDADLRRILLGRVPRVYGDAPARLGGFEPLAPNSQAYRDVIKMKFSFFRRKTMSGGGASK